MNERDFAMRVRRTLTILIALPLFLGLWTIAPLRATTSAPRPLVSAVEGIAITVGDMNRAIDFYAKVLFFEKAFDAEVEGETYDRLQGLVGVRMRVVRMRLGREHIDLIEYLTSRGRPVPADSRSNDRWFQHIAIIVNDMDQAYGWLRRHKVEHVSPDPQHLPDWNSNAAGIRAFYFKDPDGHPLEVLQFPPDKGDSRWQRPSDSVFLGIDHTAIVVGDTETSLRLYRDTLGMRVVGQGENYGLEQERLNNVGGAHLRITTLRADGGPAIELLEYITPRDGRALRADARANDLTHWQTRLVVDDATSARASLVDRFVFLSAGVVTVPDATLGFREAFVGRDPDGHAMVIGAR